MNVEVADWEPADSAEQMMAVRVISAATNDLSAAGVASPRSDAELLAAHVLGVPRGRLALSTFDPERLAEYRRLVAQRARRVPLQYLLGTAAFRYLELAVGPGVFIPRPETELLVDWALTVLGAGPATVVDLGAGSGAIALSVAHEVAQADVYAVERAPAALRWLRRNAADRADAGDTPITVVAGDLADPTLLSTVEGRVDLVLSNPPYVPDSVAVPPEVGEHDPADAVFAGPDGLSAIRSVVATAARLLRPGGWVGVEHDDTHGAAVPALFIAGGRFVDVRMHRDLAGRPRFTVAKVAHLRA